MIVADTNVIASLYLSTTSSHHAERALRRDPQWMAPILWRSEMRNVLASMLRTGRIGLQHAFEVASAAEALVARREFAVPSDEVLRLASESGCTAYDCEFVALALSTGTQLVTLDRALATAFPDVAIPLRAFARSALL